MFVQKIISYTRHTFQDSLWFPTKHFFVISSLHKNPIFTCRMLSWNLRFNKGEGGDWLVCKNGYFAYNISISRLALIPQTFIFVISSFKKSNFHLLQIFKEMWIYWGINLFVEMNILYARNPFQDLRSSPQKHIFSTSFVIPLLERNLISICWEIVDIWGESSCLCKWVTCIWENCFKTHFVPPIYVFG